MNKNDISAWFQSLQNDICQQLEKADDGGKFKEDIWNRTGGGGGQTRILKGKHIEKGGVNFSAVHGELPEFTAKSLGIAAGNTFFATGTSLVLHPHNPFVPIIHMNVRYFETSDGNWWFGGGIDLTPHYVQAQDAQFFHSQLKQICDKFDVTYYPKFKTWADDYFYIRHRQETRGVGGIFFDSLNEKKGTQENIFTFVQAIGNGFCPIYLEILDRNKDTYYEVQHKNWQMLRRGRYTEFNLVWDRGTKFGLETDGRTESILMSLPPLAAWEYDFQPLPDSEEERTLLLLKKNINWCE